MKKPEALKLAREALKGVEFELSLHSENRGTVSNIAQLKRFKANLEQICAEIEAHKLTKHNFGIARAVVDSWPFSSNLGELLIKAERAYLGLPL